jgi:electron transfer flavoprotein alpha subunit
MTTVDVSVLAVVVARGGQLPAGADEAVAEAGGAALVVGSGAREAAEALVAASRSWWAETGPGLRAGSLAARLALVLGGVPLVVLPASPDGRDLAPRLAAALDRPLLAAAVRIEAGPPVSADLSRIDGRLLTSVRCAGPAVATLLPGVRAVSPASNPEKPAPLDLPDAGAHLDVDVVEVLEPDPSTMDLPEARRVFAGGAGLVARDASDAAARGMFELLARVARALDASAGATRVATDAGWIGYERQIGTTGVAIDPELYVAFGISGASQHVGGLGAPRHVVSVNTDQSSPMTAMADLGLVTDAGALLRELARRLGVEIPAEVADE